MEGYWYLQNTASVTIAVLVLLVSSPDSVQAQCTNFYIEEPPPELFCNPYLFQSVSLACTVLVDSLLPVSVDLSIEWYHVPSGLSEPQLIGRSDFHPLLTTQEGFSSEIIINNVAEGSYYCQPLIAGRGPLLPSQSTRIEPFYSQTFACDFNILTAPSSRCAEEGVAPQNAPPFAAFPITLIVFANFNTQLTPSPPPALIPGCPYQYIEEPPFDPTCNPYPANTIGLSCALQIDASRVPGQILTIDCMYKSSDDIVPTVLQSFLRPLDVSIGLATVRTSFTLVVSNRPEGAYYCQPFLQGNIPLLASKHLMVRPAGSYDSLPPCSGEVVSVPSMRCSMKLNSTVIDGAGEDIINHNATQNSTPEVMQGDAPSEPPNTTFDNSFGGLPVWVYAIAAIGTIILVCVGIMVTFSVMFCRWRKHKATACAANRVGQTLPGESTSIYSLSPLITPGQSKAPSTRTSNSQDQYHYYSRPQWPTLSADVEQSVASSEAYTLPRIHTYMDSSNADGSGNCSSCGSNGNGNDESITEREYSSLTDVTTGAEREYSSLTDVTTGAERPIRVPSPYEEALNTSTDYCNDSASVCVCVNKSSKASYKGLDPTEGGEEDMNYENYSPYTLPARSAQRAEGDACNKGQRDCKSQPASPKSPAGAYKGLNVETMDYTSLYSRGVAPSSIQPYRALESSKMQPPAPYARPVRQ